MDIEKFRSLSERPIGYVATSHRIQQLQKEESIGEAFPLAGAKEEAKKISRLNPEGQNSWPSDLRLLKGRIKILGGL